MTIIAWDGYTLAADKAAHNNGYLSTVTKIYRVPDGLVGLSGDGDAAMDLLEWFQNGRIAKDYPAAQKGNGDRSGALFIDKQKQIWSYDKSPNAQQYMQKFHAMGCGRDYAMATMHLGFDSVKAVEVACALDVYCGNGIDCITFD